MLTHAVFIESTDKVSVVVVIDSALHWVQKGKSSTSIKQVCSSEF